MHEAVQMSGRLFDVITHIIVTIQVEDIRYKVKGILIMLDFSVESGQIEPICQILLVDIAEILVSA